MNIVESTARDKGILKKQKISDGWFRRFIKRQSKLTLRKGDCTAFVSMDAMQGQIQDFSKEVSSQGNGYMYKLYAKQKHLGCKKSARPIRSHNGYISDQKL